MQTENKLQLASTGNQSLPLLDILDEAVSKPQKRQEPSQKKAEVIKESLDQLFPEQQYEEKAIQKTKQILGELSKQFTPQQLKEIAIEVQFLADTWLDDFERKTFQGKTLKELLHERS